MVLDKGRETKERGDESEIWRREKERQLYRDDRLAKEEKSLRSGEEERKTRDERPRKGEKSLR